VNGHTGGGERVVLRFQVFQVESEVEDICIGHRGLGLCRSGERQTRKGRSTHHDRSPAAAS
jgi:hypothetical protein